jgi:hypothetical protein
MHQFIVALARTVAYGVGRPLAAPTRTPSGAQAGSGRAAGGRRGRRPKPGAGVAAFDALEPRRLLATYTGTAGDDVVRVFGSTGATGVARDIHVVINGAEFVTTDSQVTISTLGGEDTVYLNATGSAGIPREPYFIVHLGTGNDYFTNANPATSKGAVDAVAFETDVRGDGGTDAIGIDNTGGVSAQNVRLGTVSGRAPNATYLHFSRTGFANYRVEAESLDVVLGNSIDNVHLANKPVGMSLNLATGGGDDDVTFGDLLAQVPIADIDSSGWTAATTTVSGGTGVDRMTVFDQFDDSDDVVKTIGVSGFTLNKGGAGMTYPGFDWLTVYSGFRGVVNLDGPASGLTRVDVVPATAGVVNVRAVSQQTNVYTTGFGRGTVNVGAGDLSLLTGPVYVVMRGQGDDRLNVIDHNSHGGNTYLVEAGRLTRNPASAAPFVLECPAFGQLDISPGGGNDFVNVVGVAAGQAVHVHGNHGNDSLYVGGGYLANVLGPVTLDGGPGTDDVRFDNGGGTTFTDVVLTATTFVATLGGGGDPPTGPTHTYGTAESVSLIHGSGGARTEVRSLAVPLSATGSAGDDVIVVGGGDFDANFAPGATVFFDGYPGDDRIEYDDRLDTNAGAAGAGEYTLDAELVPFGGGLFLRYDRLRRRAATVSTWRVERRVLNASDDANLINVLDAGAGLRVDANGGDDQVNVAAAPAATPVVVRTGDGVDGLAVNTPGGPADAPATVLFEASDEVDRLAVNAGGTLRVGPGAVLTKRGGAFGLQGMIDLAAGAMIVQGAAAQLAAYGGYVKGGYNGGAWNGTGTVLPDGTAAGAIHSSAAAASPLGDAVGVARAADVFGAFPATFAGHSVGAADLLLRHTLGGDANLDGAVDFSDLVALAQNYDAAGRLWAEGDFDYDTVVDFNDLVTLAQNYDRSMPGAPVAAPATPAEPFAAAFARSSALAGPPTPTPPNAVATKPAKPAPRRPAPAKGPVAKPPAPASKNPAPASPAARPATPFADQKSKAPRDVAELLK